MTRPLERVCARCKGSKPCPQIKHGSGYIHSACRTDEERRSLSRRPFSAVKANGRRNHSTKALHTPALNHNKEGRCYLPEDMENPLKPGKTPGVGPQPWHEDALYFRHEEGRTVRECARICEVSFTRMQKFLNPESKARAKAKQVRVEREKRHSDPDYAQCKRDYNRRYAQAKKAGRTK